MDAVSHYTGPSAQARLVATASSSSTNVASKPRKIDRACDFCRRRKTKCDGARMANNVCSNCLQNMDGRCTYEEASKPRGPPKAYVTRLEDRLESIERLLQDLHPDMDLTKEFGPPIIRDSWKTGNWVPRPPLVSYPLPPKRSPSYLTPRFALPPLLSARDPNVNTLHSDDFSDDEQIGYDSDYNFGSSDGEDTPKGERPLVFRPSVNDSGRVDLARRFHGESSGFRLVKVARTWKREHVAGQLRSHGVGDSGLPVLPIKTEDLGDEEYMISDGGMRLRNRFWKMGSWELCSEKSPDSPEFPRIPETEYPPPDLARDLIDLYFANMNMHFPLLHRPTFERQWDSRLHDNDPWFARMCMMLFAVASRWSDDPRVLWHKSGCPLGEAAKGEWFAAGWRFFVAGCELPQDRRDLLVVPCLFELQTLALGAMFVRGTNYGSSAWVFVGIGLRKAQDAGIHRKKVYSSKPSVEGELWKRVFWHFIAFDRCWSASLGRPCCVMEEDFDLEFPLEVDDEYWETEDPSQAFKQPAGKPSLVSAFNSFLKLCQIMSLILRTIYCIDKSKVLIGLVGPHWQEETIKRLNAACANWLDSVPEHLKWSPTTENLLFSNQSFTLYTTYYLARILIYRPLINPRVSASQSRPPAGPVLTPPPLTICISAARSCLNLVETQIMRGLTNIPAVISVGHACVAILLIYVWEVKSNGMSLVPDNFVSTPKAAVKPYTPEQALDDARKFMKSLEMFESRWMRADEYLEGLRASWPTSNDDTVFLHPVPQQAHDWRATVDQLIESRSLQAVVPQPSEPLRDFSYYETRGVPGTLSTSLFSNADPGVVAPLGYHDSLSMTPSANDSVVPMRQQYTSPDAQQWTHSSTSGQPSSGLSYSSLLVDQAPRKSRQAVNGVTSSEGLYSDAVTTRHNIPTLMSSPPRPAPIFYAPMPNLQRPPSIFPRYGRTYLSPSDQRFGDWNVDSGSTGAPSADSFFAKGYEDHRR